MAKQCPVCGAEYEDKSNQYFEILECEFCGNKEHRTKMTNEEEKK